MTSDQLSPSNATSTEQTQKTPMKAMRILYCGDPAFTPFLNFIENIGILLTISAHNIAVEKMMKKGFDGQPAIRLCG